jgi:hypothetical protein
MCKCLCLNNVILPVHTSNYYIFLILQIQDLTSQAQRNSGAASIAIDELQQARSRLDECNSKIGELESANAAYLVSVCQRYTLCGVWAYTYTHTKQTNSVALSSQANYTD